MQHISRQSSHFILRNCKFIFEWTLSRRWNMNYVQRGFFWIVIYLCLALLLYVRLLKPLVLLRHPYRVERVRKEKGNSWTLVLRPEGHRGFTFKPGQFAWLTIRNSPFALKEHPFSLSSSAMQPQTIHLTIKQLGDFTRRIKDISPGQTAYLDGPYGAFSIDRHPYSDYIFIAGGIGIAPIMCMLRTLADRGDERALLLFYAYVGLIYGLCTSWKIRPMIGRGRPVLSRLTCSPVICQSALINMNTISAGRS